MITWLDTVKDVQGQCKAGDGLREDVQGVALVDANVGEGHQVVPVPIYEHCMQSSEKDGSVL